MEATAVSVCALFHSKVLSGFTRNRARGVYVEPTPHQLTVWWGCGAGKSAGIHPGAVWETTWLPPTGTDRLGIRGQHLLAQLMFFGKIIKDDFDLQCSASQRFLKGFCG